MSKGKTMQPQGSPKNLTYTIIGLAVLVGLLAFTFLLLRPYLLSRSGGALFSLSAGTPPGKVSPLVKAQYAQIPEATIVNVSDKTITVKDLDEKTDELTFDQKVQIHLYAEKPEQATISTDLKFLRPGQKVALTLMLNQSKQYLVSSVLLLPADNK